MPTNEAPSTSVFSTIATWMQRHPVRVFLLLVALLVLQISPNWKPDPDGVNYLSIARNLALHGRFMRHGMSHLYYAPGYSVLISPAFFFGARPFAEIGVIHLVLAILLMLATYRWFVRYDSRGAIFITAMVMVNVGFWDLYRQTRAETAFMAALMGSAVLSAAITEARALSRFIMTTVAAALLVMVMCSIRQVGILLAGGFAVTLFIRAIQKRISWSRAIIASAVISASGVAVVLGLMLYDAYTAKESGPEEVTYFENRRDPRQSMQAQVIEGIRRQTAEIGRLVLPGMWKSYSRPRLWLTFNTFFYLLISAIVAVGWWKLMRATLDPLVAAFPFYFLLFVVWPFDQGTRFTVPMLPVLAASIWYLLQYLGNNRQVVFVILILLHVVTSVGTWARDANIVRRWNQEWPSMERVAAAIPIDSGMIVASDIAPEKWLFLTYLTDRRFIWKSREEPIPERANLIISPAGSPDTPEFEPITIVEGLKIEHRTSHGYFVFNR